VVLVVKQSDNPRQGECGENRYEDHHNRQPWVKPQVNGLRPTQEALGFQVSEKVRED
jgi:hypothetical protein